MRKIAFIVIHCTATRAGQAFTAADIDRWHRARGFEEIGYHYVVGLDGYIELGRPIEKVGAHAKGINSTSIGVVYVGGLDSAGRPADTRTPAQKASLLRLLKHLKEIFPEARIISHRDVAAKACPCFDATREYFDI